ncbi:MAG: molybdopterin-dependent oxidoreductase [Nitrospiraceae bacterium]|nr:molybdopterin-dependent oxidoreductase [Nitrospiraceae bacterium]
MSKRKKITRREFIKTGVAIGTVVTFCPDLFRMVFGVDAEARSKSITYDQIIRTACSPSCAGQVCGMNAFVKNGKIVKIEPAEFPDPKYKRICLKGLTHLERTYHKDRLKYPMKRVGERGSGKWKRITWDEALDTIASKITEIKEKHGSDSLVFMPVGGGTSTVLNSRSGWRLANLLDAQAVASISLHGDLAVGNLMTLSWKGGTPRGSLLGYTEPSDYKNSKLIILWGENTSESRMMDMHFMYDAMDNGAKIVVIDPRFTSTASRANKWIPIKPGTDGALALSMMHVIIDKNLHDKNFIAKYTVGPFLVRSDNGMFLRDKDINEKGGDDYMVFDQSGDKLEHASENVDQALIVKKEVILKNGSKISVETAFSLLKQLADKYPPKVASEITNIPAAQIEQLAIEYGKTKPSLIRIGRSFHVYMDGHNAQRAVITLGALTGNIGNSGGGVLHGGGTQAIGGSALSRFNMKEFLSPTGKPLKVLPGLHLTGNPDIAKKTKFLWVSGKNPINQSPAKNKFVNEILPNYEFFVVMDQFMTVTAEYADIVLPACSWFEKTDIAVAVHYYLQLQQKVIEPMYEAKPEIEVYGEIAKRLGFGKYFEKTTEEWLEILLNNPNATELKGITLAKLKQGACRINVPDPYIGWADKKFLTDSGRIEFYVEWLKEFGEELPLYKEPFEVSPLNPLFKKYPLMFQQGHTRYYAHSQFGGYSPSILELNPEPQISIHPSDATPRRIKSGDFVNMVNDRGRLKCKALVTEGIMPGCVHIPEGWWPKHYRGGHHNDLTHDTLTKATSNNKKLRRESNSPFYDTLVEVKKA